MTTEVSRQFGLLEKRFAKYQAFDATTLDEMELFGRKQKRNCKVEERGFKRKGPAKKRALSYARLNARTTH